MILLKVNDKFEIRITKHSYGEILNHFDEVHLSFYNISFTVNYGLVFMLDTTFLNDIKLTILFNFDENFRGCMASHEEPNYDISFLLNFNF